MTLRLRAELGFAGGHALMVASAPVEIQLKPRDGEALDDAVERWARERLSELLPTTDPELVVDRGELEAAPWGIDTDAQLKAATAHAGSG